MLKIAGCLNVLSVTENDIDFSFQKWRKQDLSSLLSTVLRAGDQPRTWHLVNIHQGPQPTCFATGLDEHLSCVKVSFDPGSIMLYHSKALRKGKPFNGSKSVSDRLERYIANMASLEQWLPAIGNSCLRWSMSLSTAFWLTGLAANLCQQAPW